MAKQDKLTANIGFFVTEADKARICELAAAAHCLPSPWVRMVVMQGVERLEAEGGQQ